MSSAPLGGQRQGTRSLRCFASTRGAGSCRAATAAPLPKMSEGRSRAGLAPRGESPRVGTGPSPGRSSHAGSAGWGHLGFLPAFQRKQSSCAPSAAAGPFPRRACRLVGQAHPQLTADIPTTNSRQVLHKSLSTLPQGATLCLAGTETPFIPEKQTDPCSGRDRNSVLSQEGLTEEENYSRIRFRIPPAPSLETLKEVVWGGLGITCPCSKLLPVPSSSCAPKH